MLEVLAEEKKFWEEFTGEPSKPKETQNQPEAPTTEKPAATATEQPPLLHMQEREEDPNAEPPKLKLLDVKFK